VADLSLEALLADLQTAAIALRALAPEREILGIQAVEIASERRHYLGALSGPTFICLDEKTQPVTGTREVHEVAAAVLLCERAGDEVDIEALHLLARSAAAMRAAGSGQPDLDATLEELAAAAFSVAAWRAAPERALSSLTAVETVTQLHDRLRGAHAAYLAITEPLAQEQDVLSDETIAQLRELDERAAVSRAATPFATRLGEWIFDCNEGAAEIVAKHVTPLH
jgi:hypothetical protein